MHVRTRAHPTHISPRPAAGAAGCLEHSAAGPERVIPQLLLKKRPPKKQDGTQEPERKNELENKRPTFFGHSCRKETLLWDTLVRHFRHSCRTLLWTLVQHSCGTFLWDTHARHSRTQM